MLVFLLYSSPKGTNSKSLRRKVLEIVIFRCYNISYIYLLLWRTLITCFCCFCRGFAIATAVAEAVAVAAVPAVAVAAAATVTVAVTWTVAARVADAVVLV